MLYYILTILFYILKPIIYIYLVVLKLYRRQIVEKNLDIAFQGLDLGKKKKIVKGFYSNFYYFIFETIELFFISKNKLKKKVSINNSEAFESLKKEKSGAIVLTAHFFNWEYAGIIVGLGLEQPMQVVYKTLSNSFFDKLLIDIRTRFGNRAVTMENTARSVISGKNEGLVTCFLADQTPMINPNTPFYFFLQKEVPFFDGYAKLAKKLDLPVYYGEVTIKAGKYEVNLFKLDSTKDIVSEYVSLLENSIIEHPENWLWTHRRFKRAK